MQENSVGFDMRKSVCNCVKYRYLVHFPLNAHSLAQENRISSLPAGSFWRIGGMKIGKFPRKSLRRRDGGRGH
jgi:hypothetical protein